LIGDTSMTIEKLSKASAAERLFSRVHELTRRPVSLMEVCGTHTMAICRHGLRARLPKNLRLISGPGCPACVTPCDQIDAAVAMSAEPGVTLVTFGDMLRVPGSTSSLERERADGRDIRVVYSPLDGLNMATEEPDRLFVFLGIGFETTSPLVAATLVRAAELHARNFLLIPAFKLVPPAMAALVRGKETKIDGFLCPGHVSAIIGSAPYEEISSAMGVPCVITGFEALDILEGIAMSLEQIAGGRSQVEIQYSRAVPQNGNPEAMKLAASVFRPCDSQWRGIGFIPNSGLELNEEFAAFNARGRIEVEIRGAPDLQEGCSCGEVMTGLLTPFECPLFGSACDPSHPIGPCMVSSEGACAAYHRYGG
jgi:hydrogenase expression/formation protein HypD